MTHNQQMTEKEFFAIEIAGRAVVETNPRGTRRNAIPAAVRALDAIGPYAGLQIRPRAGLVGEQRE